MPIVIKPGKISLPTYGKTLYFDLKFGTVSEKDKLINLTVTRRTIRRGIDNFKFTCVNPNRYFIGRYSLGQMVYIYIDYTDGTYETIRGKIEEPVHGYNEGQGFITEFFGRNIPEIKDRKGRIMMGE